MTLYNPTITSFSPESGPVGTTVTITGTHLLNSTGDPAVSVYFGNLFANSPVPAQEVTPSTNTATSIVFDIPAKSITGFMGVVTDVGAIESETKFEVTPGVTSYSPETAHVNEFITILGTGLAGSTVTIDDIDAELVYSFNDMIVVKIPATATTGCDVVVTTGKTVTTCTPALTIN